ncbi:MAG: LamG domain-containing protein [Bryobacteraceae bacterium]
MRTWVVLSLSLCAAAAADLRDSLTFFAPFDTSTDATVAAGDKRVHFADSYKQQSLAQPGLPANVVHATSGGHRGGALHFTSKNTRAVFYRAARNVAFDPRGWNGTVAFRLKLDPDKDLEPGFCDPIQLTGKAYNDSAIWVDFTKDDRPRHFRLGVFGQLTKWNPRNLPSDQFPAFERRLVVVEKPPFRADRWTHVAIVFDALGHGGKATLYLDGQPQGTSGAVAEAFEWDEAATAIRLGVNYVGWMDEVAVFNRPLSASEVARLAQGGW